MFFLFGVLLISFAFTNFFVSVVFCSEHPLLEWELVGDGSPVYNVGDKWRLTVMDSPTLWDANHTDGIFYMFVEGFSGGLAGEEIGVMNTSDYGVTWSWCTGGGDPIASISGNETWNSNLDEACPRIINVNGYVYLFYSSHNNSGGGQWSWNIGLANVSVADLYNGDDFVFSDMQYINPLVSIGDNHAWDECAVYHPSTPISNGTYYHMFYSGRDENASHGIGLMVCPVNDYPYSWSKVTVDEPLFVTSTRPSPEVVYWNGMYYMLYHNGDAMVRESSDLLNWDNPKVLIDVSPNISISEARDFGVLSYEDEDGIESLYLATSFPSGTFHTGMTEIVVWKHVYVPLSWWETDFDFIIGLVGLFMVIGSPTVGVILWMKAEGDVDDQLVGLYWCLILFFLGLVLLWSWGI